MKRAKKLISLVLSMVMLLSITAGLNLSAYAHDRSDDDVITSGDYEYIILDDGTAEITDYTSYVLENELVIPSTIDGYTVTSLGELAFSNAQATSIVIPNTVTIIEECAFWGNDYLKSITIPKSVTDIDIWAFENCENLTNVTIGDGVTSIGRGTFYNCKNLTSVTIGNSVTSIGAGAFENCSKLKSIIIPNSVKSIGNGLFYDCTNLTSVTIGSGLVDVGSATFLGCTNLKSITIDNNNANYSSKDGVLFNKDKTTLIKYPVAKEGTSYTIPNTVTDIGSVAFEECSGLTSITIPDSVTSIGNLAFEDCSSLKSITIPDSVTSIGISAFCGTAYYNNSKNWEKDVLYIDNMLIEAKDTISGKYTIKSGTKVIADHAFYDCSGLTSVTIPDSVTSIGNGAFKGCTSLTNITIPKSVTSIGDYNDDLLNAVIDYNYIYSDQVKLSKTKYTYDGNAKKPTVTVTDINGNKVASSNYTVKYSNNTKVGKATVKITFKGNYTGTVTKTFKINPKSTSISSVSAKSKGFTVKWKKKTTQVTGYQIRYSTSSKFKNAKTVTIKSNKTTSKKIKNLKAKKKYYVQVRTYKTVDGTKYYSSWSKAKTIKTK